METLTRLVVECMARHGFPDGSVRTLFPPPPAGQAAAPADAKPGLPPSEVALAPPGTDAPVLMPTLP